MAWVAALVLTGTLVACGPSNTCISGQTRGCYTGAGQTEGIGACVGGTQTCLPSSEWGPCEGQVLPQTESCDTPEDDDCDGQTNEDGPTCICNPGQTQACYTGAAGTENVGPCQGGTQTCNNLRNGWGPCAGEILPQPEICDDGVDDDCDGVIDNVLDIDGDGWTVCDGDCCETEAECSQPELVNPGAVEVIAAEGEESVDENCDGQIDEPPPTCDSAIALDDTDPIRGANAIGICALDAVDGFGIVSAAWVRADGSSSVDSLGYGITPTFGPNMPPREGASLLVLSSGHARLPSQPNACGNFSCSTAGAGTPPAGFPQDVPGCDGASDINDDIVLELTLRAPSNAEGFSFDFSFYSFEYPEWVCTSYNDQFIALMDPAPAGAINGNIAFDSQTNPVSVNIAFFDVCDGCANGTAALQDTGFDTWDDAGATSWLRTQAPVTPGEVFTLRFIIWDTGDQAWDSTVVIDNFQWLGTPVSVGTAPVVE